MIHYHAEPVRGDAEGGGKSAGEFAVDFHGDVVGAGDAQFAGVEVVDILELRMHARDRAGEVAQEIEVADVFRYDHVEQAVVEAGVGEDFDRHTVVATIADEDEAAVTGDAVAFDGELGRAFGGELGGIDEIAKGAEALFELTGGAGDDLRIEADASELDEVLVIGLREVDLTGGARFDDFPSFLDVAGEAEFVGEDIHGSHGEDAERAAAAGDAVDDFIDGAVAARSDDDAASVRRCALGDAACIAGRLGGLDAGAGEGADFLPSGASAVAAGSGIDDDDDVVFHGDGAGQGNPAFAGCARLRSFRAVKRLSKVILIALAAILAVAACAVVGLRIYVQGDSGRAKLEEAVGKALKLPVRIGKIALQLPSTLRVDEIASVDSGALGQPKIAAKALRGTLALRPLLGGEFEFRDVVLEEPTFDWPQTAQGRWAWPEEAKEKSGPKSKEPKVEKVPSQKTTVGVRGIKLVNGIIHLRNSNGEPVITAADVVTEFSEVSERQLLGAVTIGRLVWGERYAFEKVRTKLSYAGEVLVLDELEATTFGGSVRGRYEMDTKADGQPFKARIALKGVDLNSLSIVAGWADGEVLGRLNGEAEMSGRTDRIERLEGPGRISIEGGRFKKLDVFESIAQLVGLGELANFQPRETTAEFKLRDEKMFIESLVFATENLRISANGVARFDGKLTLDARLAMPERFMQTIPEIARGSFTKLDDGRRGLDFKITGKTNKPKTDLAERLIGGKVQDKLGDLLGNLFGSKPDKKDDKKKDGEKPAAKPDEQKQ